MWLSAFIVTSASMLYDVMEGLVVDAHIGKYRMNERESAMKHIDLFMKLKITVKSIFYLIEASIL